MVQVKKKEEEQDLYLTLSDNLKDNIYFANKHMTHYGRDTYRRALHRKAC